MEKILILGGTNFIGRNLIEQLMFPGEYDLTIFNRGVTNSNLFPKIKKIKGDRNSNEIGKLISGNWDYIIDISCYFPRSLEEILNSKSIEFEKYIFISTCSVYRDEDILFRNELASIQECSLEEYDNVSKETYGKRKSKCEELLKSSNNVYTILRPSLVYGQYDNTDRFYYWLHQVKNYNDILIPEKGEQKFSLTYVFDLIKTIELSINKEEEKHIYNVISHPEASIAKIIETTGKLLNKSPELKSVSSKHLKDNNVSEWVDMPLWLNCDYFTYSNKKLLNKYGPIITDFESSIQQTIGYYEKRNWPEPHYGINRKQQLELIENGNSH